MLSATKAGIVCAAAKEAKGSKGRRGHYSRHVLPVSTQRYGTSCPLSINQVHRMRSLIKTMEQFQEKESESKYVT